MRLSELIAKSLKISGINFVFGSPGTTELSLVNDLIENNIKFLFTVHDTIAVGMADGFARASGKPTVVCLHASQGMLNAAGFIRVAYRDNSPIIIIAGMPSTTYSIFEPNHFVLRLDSNFAQITKWGWTITNPTQVSQVLKRAFQIAMTPPMGPTYIFIPQDILEQKIDPKHVESIKPFPLTKNVMLPEFNVFLETSNTILNAGKPLFFVGQGICRYGAQKELTQFAKEVGAPIIGEAMDRGSSMILGKYCNKSETLYAGYFDIRDRTIRRFIQEADLIVLIGTRSTYDKVVGDFPSNCKIIQITDDPLLIGKDRWIDLALVGNICLILNKLYDICQEILKKNPRLLTLQKRRLEEWASILANQKVNKQKSPKFINSNSSYLTTLEIIEVMNQLPCDDIVLVDDSQCFGYYLKKYLDLKKFKYIYGSMASHLGWGIPSSLGVKLALPDNYVICTISDGSFLFGIQGLATAATYTIPIIILVINNGGSVSLKKEVTDKFKTSVNILDCLSINRPEFHLANLARAFGLNALRVKSRDELFEACKHATENNYPTIIEIMTSPMLQDWNESWYVS